MMEAVRTSETSVDNHFTRQYNPEHSSEHHTRRRENLKSHKTRSACEYSVSVSVQFLRNWREIRPSNQGCLVSTVTGEIETVYYTKSTCLKLKFVL
jgi:hypothetical protein